MDYAVVNVGAFADKDIRATLTKMANIRTATLEKCYSMAGYDTLPLDEKNAIYDKVRKEIEASI